MTALIIWIALIEEDWEMATAIAHRYGLPLEMVDLQKEYWEQVAAYAIDKIRRGLTLIRM